MAQVEALIKPIIPEGFTAVSPEIAVFMTALCSYVDSKGGIVAAYGSTNIIHFKHRPRRTHPAFSSSFYYEKPVELSDGTYLLGGIDRTDGNAQIEGKQYDLYRSHDLVYDQTHGFGVIEMQSGTPVPFYGEGAITVWGKPMTKKGIQRLSRRLFTAV